MHIFSGGLRKAVDLECAALRGGSSCLPQACKDAPLGQRQGGVFRLPPSLPLDSTHPAMQQLRPPPAAETGRSCWGSGQQDARAAQGTMRMLGAATRKKRKPFQIVLLSNPHPVCKLNLQLFFVLRRFLAILRQCKKLCGFCLTGGCLRAIMNT